MQTITAQQLKEKIDNNEDVMLIDVREPHEHETANIGGLLMPLATVTQNIDAIPKNKPVIFYCRVGVRSQIAIQRLEDKFSFQNLYNLTGGIEEWQRTQR